MKPRLLIIKAVQWNLLYYSLLYINYKKTKNLQYIATLAESREKRKLLQAYNNLHEINIYII